MIRNGEFESHFNENQVISNFELKVKHTVGTLVNDVEKPDEVQI
jgi:hypothetical protein